MMRHTLTTSILCLALATLGVWPASAQMNRNPPPEEAPSAAGDSLDAFILNRMNELGIPAVSLAVLRGNEVLKLAAYGKANLELDVPASPATVFPYASITKAFTGTAILRLVERNRLSLDDRVVELLPGLPETWSGVTVRQLLSHTSGLPDMALGEAGVSNPMMLRDLLIATTLDSAMAVLPTMPLPFVAGRSVAYNQTNYLLLALLLERLHGRTIEDFVLEEFAQPLGLTSLAFGDSRAVMAGRASWYTRMDLSTGRPEWVSVRPLWIEYPDFAYTIAGLNGTALDLARFVAAVGSGEILGDASRRAMWTAATLADGSVARMGPFGVAPGWLVDDPEGRSVSMNGAASGAVRYYVDDDLTVAVLTNLQGADPYALVDGVAKAYLTAGIAPRSDTVHVAPPAGVKEDDRASILAALAAVQEGGTVQFAAGTYLIGEMISVSTPRVSLLGHPEGTTLRGCNPEDVAGMQTSMEVCNGLELAAARQTVRGFTFEHAFWALHLGCCYHERTTYDFPDGSTHELPVVRRGEGGHRVEGNTFRSAANGIRVNGGWTEPSIVRGNRFIDNWHAISINGHTVHVLDNHFSVPQPERVPDFGYAWDAIKIAPPLPIQGATGPPSCIGNVIAGNTIDGYLDGIRVEVYLPGSICRENVIRNNTITVRRAHNPTGIHFRDGGVRSDSSVVGVPIALLNDPIFTEGVGSDAPALVEENIVEGNRILGAEGIGIEILRAARNRIANNIIERVVAREPFPGNTMAGEPDAWRHANGSGIWISPGSDTNEIVGNTFVDIAAPAIVVEGDRNIVETRSAADTVRDLGTDNRVSVSAAALPGSEPTPQSRSIRVDGDRLQYLDFGGEGLPVLFTAGSRPAQTWAGFAPRFVDRNRVIAITPRGVPPSEGQETGYVQSARDILALLDSLGFERAVLVGNSNPAPMLIYLAEHYPERVAGFVFLAPASEAGFESAEDPSGAMQMVRRAFLSSQGRDPDEAGGPGHLYRPRYFESGSPRISIPALTFVNRDGTRGLERVIYPLQVAGLVADGTLQVPDSVARSYFERLAEDSAMQREVRAAWNTVMAAPMIANEHAFSRAFGENLRIVQLDVPLIDGVPVVTGYEYRDSPDLIEADIRQFLAEVATREAAR